MKKSMFLLLLSAIFAAPTAFADETEAVAASDRWQKTIWDARWIASGEVSEGEFEAYRFRKTFPLERVPSRFVINISADPRYELFVNGRRVHRGPARGTLQNWCYETLDIAPYLKEGDNVIAATVWNYGRWSGGAQVSLCTGLIVQGETERESAVDTDSSWKSRYDRSLAPSLVYLQDVEPGLIVDGNRYPWGWEQPGYDDSRWPSAVETEPGRPALACRGQVRALVPRTIPLMESRPENAPVIRRSEGINANDNFKKDKPLTVPARTRATLLLDQQYLTNAYPTLTVSGGKGAKISLTYSEAMYVNDREKGNRNEIEGKHIRGFTDVFYPDGYSINDVVKEMKSVEEHLAKQPEVKKVSITFGSTPLRYYLASTSVGPKPNFANVLVELTDSKYTKEYEEDFDAYMKANYPNAITRTSLFKLSPAVDAAIEIGFIGPNVDTLVALTNQALEIMHRNPDLINVRNSWGNKVPVWKPVYSPERAQPLGVSRQGMAQSIQIGTTGMTLGEYRQGDQVLPILLKDNTVDSFRINDLRTLPVFGTGNETTSLEQVVSEFDFQYRFSNVKDYNRQMVMMAQCDPRRGVNAIAAFNEVWPLVQKEIKVPEGYTMKYFGEQESQVESNEALAKNLPLTFFLMFVTLLFLFRTYRKPTVILLMLPLIFIGIVLGLVLLGKSFDFFSILGLLGLIGMNIKNAIVLVEQIDLEAKTGKKPLDAVVSATTSRIVPVAMASGTTILGMLPLLFDAMFGGMAATIMGGLLVASALTLFVLPVAYCAIQRIKG